ncbi:Hypp8291 [Branchiostoma lanceolatum]|uniref:Hypp8291 protein n=1 Tax=Branchiostoma lanceolatum TaxID=7740 RepID=A0A8K0ED75_BRALA|nr:Hypp8291 [Branchiostoma lanceolatum]
MSKKKVRMTVRTVMLNNCKQKHSMLAAAHDGEIYGTLKRQGKKGRLPCVTCSSRQMNWTHVSSYKAWCKDRDVDTDVVFAFEAMRIFDFNTMKIEDLAKQAEEAAGKGNLKDLYITTRKLAGKFPQVDKPVRDKEGNLLTTTEEQLRRWAEHFSDLLNRPVPETPPNIPHAEEELPINTQETLQDRD